MNYRHAYHAGHFADVFKHIVLVTVVQALQKKDKPLCYLDTHAGIGLYNLTGAEAQKTKEYQTGIGQIIDNTSKKPSEIEAYLNTVRALNTDGKLACYPGSPSVVQAMLRPADKMILTELHPTDFKALKTVFKGDKQVATHHLDGYQGLKAFLPPNPRRGLVLIDPPYESTAEFETILKNLRMALDRWKEGVYLIWYPVKSRPEINYFEHQLDRKIREPYIITEFNLFPDDSPFLLNGSGMVIINPPWQLADKLKPILSWLAQTLDKDNKGNYCLKIKN